MLEKSLAKLKKEYSSFEKKYKLPKFHYLNAEFEIEKLQGHETDFLLREIRRTMTDKIAAFLKFFELFLNPQAAPLFILSALKSISSQEKEKIEKIYKKIIQLEIKSISLDISYEEKREADFIKNTYEKWQVLKEELKIIDDILSKIKEETVARKDKSYFG